jgi:hypothetical protein
MSIPRTLNEPWDFSARSPHGNGQGPAIADGIKNEKQIQLKAHKGSFLFRSLIHSRCAANGIRDDNEKPGYSIFPLPPRKREPTLRRTEQDSEPFSGFKYKKYSTAGPEKWMRSGMPEPEIATGVLWRTPRTISGEAPRARHFSGPLAFPLHLDLLARFTDRDPHFQHAVL